MKKLLFIFLTVFITNPAYAATISLCTTMDGSGSVNATDFVKQRDGLADAVADSTVVPQDSTVFLSVVQFSSTAILEVASTLIDSQATATSVANQIRGITKTGGGTNAGAAIDLCASEVLKNGDRHVLDIVTDGEVSGAEAAADAAMAAGVDAINALGVDGANLVALESIVRPQPASPFPQDGFAIEAVDFTAFQNIVKEKLRAETTPTSPTTPAAAQNIPVFGPFGLLAVLSGLLWFGRRRK